MGILINKGILHCLIDTCWHHSCDQDHLQEEASDNDQNFRPAGEGDLSAPYPQDRDDGQHDSGGQH